MSVVVDVALPVFAIILLGYLLGRARLLGDAAPDALNRFVYWVALPPVLFLGAARNPIDQFFDGPFLGAYMGSLLAVYAAGAAIGRLSGSRADVASVQALNACFSNTGYMGIPLFLAAFGPEGVGPAILATVVMSAAMVAFAIVVLELAGGGRPDGHGRGVGRALADTAKAIAANPIVFAPALGLLVPLAGVELPTPAVRLGELLGAAAGPCALFAIGLFLSGRPLGGLAEVAWVSALKLVAHPLLCWWLGTAVFGLGRESLAAAVVLAALPTGATTFVVAQRYGVHVERTSSSILATTVLSVATLSYVLSLYVPAG
jgi:malonate transporter